MQHQQQQQPSNNNVLTSVTAIVATSGPSFVAARIAGNPQDMLFALARQYVQQQGLVAWKITKPLNWSWGMGPHVSLSDDMRKYKGETLTVRLLNITHFVDEAGSRWVAFNVELPPEFNCPYGCHLSIGQQKNYATTSQTKTSPTPVPVPVATTTKTKEEPSWRKHLKTSYQLLYKENQKLQYTLDHYTITPKARYFAMRDKNQAQKNHLSLLLTVLKSSSSSSS